MIKRTILVLFIFGLLLGGLLAQPAVVLHISDKTIGAKDAVEVTYEFKNISRPSLPDINFNDWDVNGPSLSQSTQIFNGNATSSVSYVFTLYPKHIGTLKVPGISFDYNGKKLSCRETTIKVLQKEHVQKQSSAPNSPFGSLLQGMPGMGLPSDIFGTPRTSAPPSSGVIVQPGQSYDQAAAHDFFIKITPSKSTFYIGEPILVDYEFFGAANCNWQPERFPSFSGFSVTDIERNLYPYDIKVNGRQYRARGIRKVQLIALKTGTLPLDSSSVRVQTTFIDAANHADRNTASAIIKSKSTSVTVIPLPTQGQPKNFSGAIGQFKIRATIDENKLPAGENNHLHIHITGNGNLDGVGVPDIKWPKGIQSYDARDSQSVNKTNFPMDRSLDFDIPFIGNIEGGMKIPPVVFNFFNPDTKKYQSDSTDTIQLQFTAPLKDNGVAESLSKSHKTNWQYLWIVVVIALIVGGIFGLAEWKKEKGKNKNKEKIKTNTGSGGLADQSAAENKPPLTSPGTSGRQQNSSKPAVIDSAAAANIKEGGKNNMTSGQDADQHEANHLQYLPEGLSAKIKAKGKPAQPSQAQDLDQQTEADTPVKSRAVLRQEAIKELEQRQDPKEFFILAKAYIVEQMQYLLHTSETDENRLLQSLADTHPESRDTYTSLINTCNKALYLPVGAEASRKQVLERIEAMEFDD